MKSLSYTAHNLQGQEMFKILSAAKELEKSGRKIYHFEIGDPDFNTPTNISTAAINSINNNETHYTSSTGLLELKEAAADATLRSRGFKPDLDQLLVTQGANVQIYYALACIINPGDEVIVPDPSFVSYFSILNFLGAKIVRVPLKESNNFRLDPKEVEKLITPFTKVIIINTPSNPTGSMMGFDDVKKIYELVKKHDIYLLSDEIYARMTYDVRHYSPSIYDSCKERVIVVNGFSKSYAMSGWRLGVVTGPSEVIEKMGLLLETILSCVSPFIQRAGIEALKGDQGQILNMMEEFRKRRDVMVDGLNNLPNITCIKPDGAFYCFPNITGTGMSSKSFSDHLLYSANVATCPGTVFGPGGQGYIRMSYSSCSIEDIERAIKKIKYIL